jgi:hypothetical protein
MADVEDGDADDAAYVAFMKTLDAAPAAPSTTTPVAPVAPVAPTTTKSKAAAAAPKAKRAKKTEPTESTPPATIERRVVEIVEPRSSNGLVDDPLDEDGLFDRLRAAVVKCSNDLDAARSRVEADPELVRVCETARDALRTQIALFEAGLRTLGLFAKKLTSVA